MLISQLLGSVDFGVVLSKSPRATWLSRICAAAAHRQAETQAAGTAPACASTNSRHPTCTQSHAGRLLVTDWAIGMVIFIGEVGIKTSSILISLPSRHARY